MPKVKVYARIRPTSKTFEGLKVQENNVLIQSGEKDAEKYSLSKYKEYDFKFSRVFDQDTSQEEVYQEVGSQMVDRFLDGFNGTIFAYGQTASGKTYTIEGSARRYTERGMIPRILSDVYKNLEQRAQEENVSVHVSFMEIYQGIGYDLLNPGTRGDSLMVTLPKVSVVEGGNGERSVKNLSTHLASTEEVALSLLFQGCTCRRVAETTMNALSSRSHAVFTIALKAQKPGSEIITRSKLQLVDLAGSERVAKTRVDGQTLQEAKYINCSLHHLEHVIVTLQRQSLKEERSSSRLSTPLNSIAVSPSRNSTPETRPKSRRQSRVGTPCSSVESFVPYRNSLLTMILRDSLGGNCLTAMIATISAEEYNINETISTCRFAQRVACISNKARRNEELDDKAVIQKLKLRVAELENEIIQLKSGKEYQMPTDNKTTTVQPLSYEDKKVCHQVLYQFLHGRTDTPVASGIDTPAKFQECLSVLRDIVMHAIRATKPSNSSTTLSPTSAELVPASDKTKKKRNVNSVNKPQPRTLRGEDSLSPSPRAQSQISSGFVSLHDEEAVIGGSPSPKSTRPHTKQAWSNESSNEVNSKGNIKISPLRKSSNEEQPHQGHLKQQETVDQSQLLKGQVDVLSFKIQEENIRGQIEVISAQLAAQQTKLIQLERVGGIDGEKMLSERIVEKQLRIKQTRLKQKLVDVQHNQKFQNVMSNTRSPAPVPTVQHAVPHQYTSPKQVQLTQNEELEKLKIIQMEKELELKEAATRRRLITIKQQLNKEASSSHHSQLHVQSGASQPQTNTHPMSKTPSKSKTPPTLNTQSTLKTPPKSNTPSTSPSITQIHATTPSLLPTTRQQIQKQSSTANRSPFSITVQPPTVHEMKYMSAAKQQKTRVARMRQCMAAAVIIQRAWRKHKSRQ